MVKNFDKYIKDGGLMETSQGLCDVRKTIENGVEGYMCYPLIGFDNHFFLSNKEMEKMINKKSNRHNGQYIMDNNGVNYE